MLSSFEGFMFIRHVWTTKPSFDSIHASFQLTQTNGTAPLTRAPKPCEAELLEGFRAWRHRLSEELQAARLRSAPPSAPSAVPAPYRAGGAVGRCAGAAGAAMGAVEREGRRDKMFESMCDLNN